MPKHTCPVCGNRYQLNYGGQRTCGRVCGQALRRRNEPPKSAPPKPVRLCKVCAGSMEGTHPRARYCSYRCRVANTAAQLNELYALACKQGWAGASWRTLLVGYLRERDGDGCSICGGAIRYDLKSGPRGHHSEQGPSIDHVVPRSQGGSDDLANLRLAHWRCNRERKARGGNEQLMLIG